MKQKMNLPNKLTILRMALVPVMVIFFYIGMRSPNFVIDPRLDLAKQVTPTNIFLFLAVAIFVIAACTDFLDGYLARKNNQVTDFGKFMDPLADKALVLVALILLVNRTDYITINYAISGNDIALLYYIAPISLIVMLIRELVISGVRLVGANKGVVIAADKLGKFKTIAQDIAIPFLMISYPIAFLSKIAYSITLYVGLAGLVIATVLSIVSCIGYIVKNKEIFSEAK